MDFIASNDSTTTAGLTWTMTGLKPRLSNYSMTNSLTAPLSIQEPYTALPSTLPNLVRTLASRVTKGANSRFESAVMLQNWFRNTGGFRYSLKRAEGDSNEALLRFLAEGNGGRVGYCEQFAAAFAVMARTLNIPSRVAIGFLQPKKTGNDQYVYSSYDMHAWPELYFRGSGWVTFEPTPASSAPGGAGGVPSYTVDPVTKPSNPKDTQNPGGRFTTDPTSKATSGLNDTTTNGDSTSSGASVPWIWILIGFVLLAVLAAIALVPGAVRRRRRSRRLDGGAEEAWVELRDTAVDLGVAWPGSRSPHETGHLLSAWFGPDPDGAPLVRPPRGRGLAPGAEDALDRIVLTLERVRYARYADDAPGALAGDVRTCIVSLENGCPRRTLRRAHWFPRSLWGGGRRAAARADLEREPEAVAAGGVVDHVG